MATPSQRLIRRLRAMGMQLPADAEVHRTYAGWVQRRAGSWSWFLYSRSDCRIDVGSQYPVTQLLKAPAWCVSYTSRYQRNPGGGISIDPAEEDYLQPQAQRGGAS